MEREYRVMQDVIRITANPSPAGTTVVSRLHEAVTRWERLNLSIFEMFERRPMPVPYSTFRRWMNGEQEPGSFRLEKTLAAMAAATAEEEARLRKILMGGAA